MITFGQAAAFSLAAFIIIVIPGPSVVFVIGRALSYGRAVAVASVIGNTLGLLTLALLVSLGLGAVVASSVLVFTTLKLIGAGYLIYLGVQAIRHRRALEPTDLDGVRRPTATVAIRQAYIVGVSNPKGIMMFAALLPQFVDRSAGAVAGQMLLLGLIAVVIGFVSDLAWAIGASGARDWFVSSPRRSEALGTVGGVSMIGLGVVMAASDR